MFHIVWFRIVPKVSIFLFVFDPDMSHSIPDDIKLVMILVAMSLQLSTVSQQHGKG